MRMRKKKNLLPRMEKAGEYLFDIHEKSNLNAISIFNKNAPLYLEIGCGKGKFLCEHALANPDKLYVGIERVPDVLVLAMEKAQEYGLKNIRFLSADAIGLADLFAQGCARGIYLNFSDPWPKARHAARRLDGPGFLNIYKYLLEPEAMLEMKTDNVGFFEFGLESIGEVGGEIVDISRDLTAENRPENVVTEYEKRWSDMGIKINYVKVKF